MSDLRVQTHWIRIGVAYFSKCDFPNDNFHNDNFLNNKIRINGIFPWIVCYFIFNILAAYTGHSFFLKILIYNFQSKTIHKVFLACMEIC